MKFHDFFRPRKTAEQYEEKKESHSLNTFWINGNVSMVASEPDTKQNNHFQLELKVRR